MPTHDDPRSFDLAQYVGWAGLFALTCWAVYLAIAGR
jgi:hypothetical protein